MAFSTFLGGDRGDRAYGIDADPNGNVYVAGITYSSDFPTTQGAFQRTRKGAFDAFVAKFSPSGELLYSTLLGGGPNEVDQGGEDGASDVAVDDDGNAYVVGYTNSDDFPIANAAQATAEGSSWDAFVTKLDPTGSSVVYSTFLGGQFDTDGANGVEVAPDGSAWVGGWTAAPDFPTTEGAFQPTYGGNRSNLDGFVTQVAAGGDTFLYSTYFGGGGRDQVEDLALQGGNVYVSGDTYAFESELTPAFPTTAGAFARDYEHSQYDAFVAKFGNDPSRLAYSTLLGGRGYEGNFAIAVDSDGNAYTTGVTDSIDFPTKNAFQARRSDAGSLNDAYLTKVNPTGSGLVFSTLFGSEGHDLAYGVGVDKLGNATIAGRTSAEALIQKWSFRPFMRDYYDGFVATFSPRGRLRYANFLGGTHPWDGAVDEETLTAVAVRGRVVYLAGHSASTYPVLRPYQRRRSGGEDAVITKLRAIARAPLHGTTVRLNRLRGHIRFSGRIIAADGFKHCTRGRRIVVEVAASDGRWVRGRVARTDRYGRFAFKNPDWPGRYRVEASSTVRRVNGRWHRCGSDRSRARIHRH